MAVTINDVCGTKTRIIRNSAYFDSCKLLLLIVHLLRGVLSNSIFFFWGGGLIAGSVNLRMVIKTFLNTFLQITNPDTTVLFTEIRQVPSFPVYSGPISYSVIALEKYHFLCVKTVHSEGVRPDHKVSCS